MFGLIKAAFKALVFFFVLIAAIVAYKYYSYYVPYYDAVRRALVFDELRAIYTGKCASLAYTRALGNKAFHSALTLEDVTVSPYASFGKWMSDNMESQTGREMREIVPGREEGWNSLASAARDIFIKYKHEGSGSVYRMYFVVSDRNNAYTEKYEFPGPSYDYYGDSEELVGGWAAAAYEIRADRAAEGPRR